jgi:hypothetical protein
MENKKNADTAVVLVTDKKYFSKANSIIKVISVHRVT